MSTSSTKELVVGVVFPAKKIGHLRNVLEETKDGVRFVLIDLFDASLTSAAAIAAKFGHLDVLLHKLAHEMVFSRLGDDAAKKRLQVMTEYVALHPQVKVIDPIDSVQLLTDRHDACHMLVKLRETTPHDEVAFNVPPFHVVDSKESYEKLVHAVESGALPLPLICKSVEACATDRSHMMSVVTQREDLVQQEYPCLYQSFINHSARLFKGYVLGDLINVAERRSLPNLSATATRVHFNTQETYPTDHDFHGTASSTSAAASTSAHSQEEIFAAVREIGERIRKTLRLSLFGFDVIVSDATNEYFVIDVNYFPSYKELDDFGSVLRRHIRKTSEGGQ
ncbi:hypothetical protein Poli38472_013515 [Pythium oligandrum]|uniref:Inositol-tetrakisphosphate 1-kinase n=1 Tax=Pythium oligandrum TaxID=41045 RepID=A0A8K1C7G2_PYTOL|nr:hypothetical protein Poli38472_013515 [Pythium oligandrum]|eukprot:TMW58041.1 hypothetical protein Poli38472_013515 [Pythium oligandrum]